MTAVRLAAWAVAGLALLASVPPAHAQKPRAERPTYAVGDRWILKDALYDLIRVDRDRYVFAAGSGRQIYLSKTLGLAAVVRDRIVEWQIEPPPELKWPLEVGKWGVVHDATFRNRSHWGGLTVRVAWEVRAHEDVQVVGGVVRAFQIVYSVDLPSRDLARLPAFPGPYSWSLSTWYAPSVERIVKIAAPDSEALNLELVMLEGPAPAPAPLELALDEPKAEARVGADRVSVGGRVKAGADLAGVTATLNGVEVFARDLRAAPTRDFPLAFPIAPRQGKNVLIVTAEDVRGGRQQEARVFFREAPPGPPVQPPPGPPVAAPPGPPVAAPPGPPAAPLQLTIASPADQARVEQERLALAGLAASGRGVTRVLVMLNGAEVARLEERPAQRAVPVNLPVALRAGPNTLVVTATDADGAVQQEVRTVHYEPLVPLTIELRHPEDRARVTDEVSLVAGVATASRGVTEVVVLLNGTEASQQRERAPRKSVPIAAPLRLREGSNTIVVRATQADGTVRQEVRTVLFERPPPPSGPTPPLPRQPGERWAVVVGIGSYQNKAIPELRFTVADAEAFYRVLIDQAGFKKENVLLLTDRTERKPTLRDLKWALGTFLARAAKKEDLVVVYYAGHGAPEVDPRGVEPDGLAKYLVPADADPNDLYSTALPMDEFHIIFERIEAERVVVFLDACYSGAAGGRTFASRRTRTARVDDIFLERLTRSRGRVLITAARGSEVSLELPELGHGIFTYYLLQGLRGTADLDHDGIVSLQELYTYLEQQVTRKSRSAGGNQHPVIKGEMEGLLPLVKVGRR